MFDEAKGSKFVQRNSNFCMNSRASHLQSISFHWFHQDWSESDVDKRARGKNACKRLEASTPPEKLSCGFSLVAQVELFPRSPSIPGSYLNSSTSHKLRASSRNREKFFRKKTLEDFFFMFPSSFGRAKLRRLSWEEYFYSETRKGFFLCRLTRDLTRNALRPISRRKF